ncbi:pre-mrna-splicing factor slt11 [Ceraceosorus bombacis]|uniref:Pre-mrna-splicing factor slt11 n=1 Tax=Ceraceosorus bombacis TaxID=401625 RepID=A0A0P1BNA9_9BASI|nr:pre-mrna-splicing factor slt11 [Ceraceosorus bombacis]
MSNQAEEAETPILCETCLGPNPYVRMSKQPMGKECKICDRPFTVFRWNPGSGMRFKKTELCTTCAKIKNVCQTCVLDLQYGLPVQVRDTAMGLQNQMPSGEKNKLYYVQRLEAQAAEQGGDQSLLPSSGPASRAGSDLLKQLSRQRGNPMGAAPSGSAGGTSSDPYRRNRSHLCSFYAKGNCTRGDACPFRHELPVDNELSKQNIKDRYLGRNDPVAKKILRTQADEAGLTAPEDQTITSLFLSSLPPTATEDSLRTYFVTTVPNLAPESIKSITHVPTSKCAFVNFKRREDAESAAMRCAVKVLIDGKEVRVAWGRSRKGKSGGGKKISSDAPEDGRDFGL